MSKLNLRFGWAVWQKFYYFVQKNTWVHEKAGSLTQVSPCPITFFFGAFGWFTEHPYAKQCFHLYWTSWFLWLCCRSCFSFGPPCCFFSAGAEQAQGMVSLANPHHIEWESSCTTWHRESGRVQAKQTRPKQQLTPKNTTKNKQDPKNQFQMPRWNAANET